MSLGLTAVLLFGEPRASVALTSFEPSLACQRCTKNSKSWVSIVALGVFCDRYTRPTDARALLHSPQPRFCIVSGSPTICAECAGRERHFYVRFRQPFVGVISLDVISYLKLSGSRLSRRPSVVSAYGYMRKLTGAPFDPGRATSCAKLYAIQFISQDPNSRSRAFFTMSSSNGRFPGGSSRTTFRTSAGSTGTQP